MVTMRIELDLLMVRWGSLVTFLEGCQEVRISGSQKIFTETLTS
jgi:hypothetical protein